MFTERGKRLFLVWLKNSAILLATFTALLLVYAVVSLPSLPVVWLACWVMRKAGILGIPAYTPLVFYALCIVVAHVVCSRAIKEL